MCFGLAVVYFLLLFFFIKRIRIAIQVLKIASKVMITTPSVILVPLVMYATRDTPEGLSIRSAVALPPRTPPRPPPFTPNPQLYGLGEDSVWSIAGAGVGGTPRGRHSTCE